MYKRQQYTTYKAAELTFVDLIRLHPVVTVWVLLIFGWLLTTMAVIMVRLSARKKAQKAAQEKAEEMAELAEHAPVSYTHLDVYKRQMNNIEPVIRQIAAACGIEEKNVIVNDLYLQWILQPSYETIAVCEVLIRCV